MNDQETLQLIKEGFNKNLKDGLINLQIDWLIQQAEKLQTMTASIPWIKWGSDNPPALNQEYICLSASGSVFIATYTGDKDNWYSQYWGEFFKDTVTHYAEINLPVEDERE
ncbi:hypothetical protein [Paenibacillus sp. PDC88]|uniref:hypothetical protein n=1 Tax=Paenibacillus sp. PDC88 TaxID=1884375 RepID=UPI00089640EB|nr:hypothetical protein [Paenibacillus sp. PDC88]SDX04890.1 hypothetical protein SAMN05518848_104190 [Paenibacillus sp. PDC88]